MRKINLIIFVCLIFCISFISANGIVLFPNNVDFADSNAYYTFNFTNSTDCDIQDVFLSYETWVSFDERGVGVVPFYFDSLGQIPISLCMYRDGIFRKRYNMSDLFVNNIYGNNATFTGNVSAYKFNGLFNWTTSDSYTSFDGNTLSFNETKLNSSIDSKLSGDLNATYWDGLDIYNSTQMENNDGTLSIILSWFSSQFDSLFNAKDTDDLAEGSLNKYDNQSWNESHANTLYYGIDNPSGYYNAYDFDYNYYSTTAEILAFGYYNMSDFDINDYYLNSNPYNYWNNTYATFNKTYADTLYLLANQGVTANTTELNYLDGFVPTANQIAYGDGTKLTSSSDVTWDGNSLDINGSLSGTQLNINSGIVNTVMNLVSSDPIVIFNMKDDTTTGNGYAISRVGNSLRLYTSDVQRLTIDSSGAVDVIQDLTAGTIQADNGFTGYCVNTTYVGGIATACND